MPKKTKKNGQSENGHAENGRPKSEDRKLYEEVEVEEVPEHEAPFDADPFSLSRGDGGGSIRLDERAGPIMHRDIGDIAVDELGSIVINRTKSGIDPFTPIVKTPNYAENSGNLTGYSVEIEHPDSETGFKHLGNVSKNYLLLTNEEVRALAVEIAHQSGLPFKESRIYWDGSRFAHVIDFLETEEVEPGDEVGLSLITRSSYDKTWRYEAALMGKRFLCDNGAISGEFFARVSFRHLKGSAGQTTSPVKGRVEASTEDVWKNVVKEGLSVIDHAPENLDRFVRGLRTLKGMKMTDDRLREVWRLFPTIGDSIKGQILSRYVDHEEPTLFGFFNAGTNVFWHREKMTSADYQNNDVFTTSLLTYAQGTMA